MRSRHRVGVAGWSYADWKGIVYPGGKLDQLVHIARYFDTVELNTTFYQPAPERTVASWLRRVSPFPDFQFTVKLWQRFTHDSAPFGKEEIDAVIPAMKAISSEGRLGAVLVQFPYSFKAVRDSRERIERIIDIFGAFQLVIEIRHASFNTPGFYDFLRQRKVGFCNIDQPLISRSIGPTAIATSSIGYVRLHGRNYKEWFKEEGDVAARYDYLYSETELREWADRITSIGQHASTVYIIANNHYRGQAAANGLQLKSLVTGEKVDAPPSLVDAYPALRDITKPAGGTGNLFE